MARGMLEDEPWARITGLLPGKPTDKGGRAAEYRQFVEALLYRGATRAAGRMGQ
jgi:hypothetical protein